MMNMRTRKRMRMRGGYPDVGLIAVILLIAFLFGILVVAVCMSCQEENMEPQDQVISVVDGVETHVMHVGVNKMDEALMIIGDNEGQVISIAYNTDGLYGISNTATIIWSKKVVMIS